MTLGQLINFLKDGGSRCGFNGFDSSEWQGGSYEPREESLRNAVTSGSIDRSIFTITFPSDVAITAKCWWTKNDSDTTSYSSLSEVL